jgi:hypothetical protein
MKRTPQSPRHSRASGFVPWRNHAVLAPIGVTRSCPRKCEEGEAPTRDRALPLRTELSSGRPFLAQSAASSLWAAGPTQTSKINRFSSLAPARDLMQFAGVSAATSPRRSGTGYCGKAHPEPSCTWPPPSVSLTRGPNIWPPSRLGMGEAETAVCLKPKGYTPVGHEPQRGDGNLRDQGRNARQWSLVLPAGRLLGEIRVPFTLPQPRRMPSGR